MDEQRIQSIVDSVLRELGEKNPAPGRIMQVEPGAVKPAAEATSGAVDTQAGAGLEDLGLEKFIRWNGIRAAVNESINNDMIGQTRARVCQGRAGPRPRTISLLRFVADHSRSKDTVVKEVPADWLAEHDLWEVQSKITDKSEYLTRPDLGRQLSDEARKTITERCKKAPQVQVVISDGLSTDAITHNLDEIIPPLLKGLKNAGFDVGTPFFLRYGRVKAQDEIGQLLQAQANLLLIGERPGLGQSESLSCYCVYAPTEKTVESDRMVIANIHQGGTPPVEAAAVIVDLAGKMLEQKASGLNLKR
ncbi:ethanolamine ammonia-lyase subunit EutC [Exilibacterium tricleocarpae]|uniref:Ethanolamine ammonia-lyase small subunit n=1 Tax=Exilibacterium tricleocarpae TaxID=2591008 RepID=A0A545TV86_9GAMM|nr:ethanolamine ammonia-lyase subunit EutC [Exilibacterium tricleocarpae]TQV81128.1 ethanolamine ammonia-lyase subunit EutC [Exilibacterium tricleocarpae]